jgi:hypothetical protein
MKNKNGTTHTMPLYRENVNFMDRMLIHILNLVMSEELKLTKSKTSFVNFQRTKLHSADLRGISGHSLYRYGPKQRASFL